MSPSTEAIVIRGMGRAAAGAANPHGARLKQVVRYADPSAWALVLAAGEALAQGGESCRAAGERISFIEVGPGGPEATMAQVAEDARSAFASPLRFPAASPSAATGLTCIAFGLHGPSLRLTLPLASGLSVALTLSARWLARGTVDYGLIGTCGAPAGGPPGAACLLLARGSDGEAAVPERVELFFSSWAGT